MQPHPLKGSAKLLWVNMHPYKVQISISCLEQCEFAFFAAGNYCFDTSKVDDETVSAWLF
jgi:hypothetical protein